jgi:hypothetical protein
VGDDQRQALRVALGPGRRVGHARHLTEPTVGDAAALGAVVCITASGAVHRAFDGLPSDAWLDFDVEVPDPQPWRAGPLLRDSSRGRRAVASRNAGQGPVVQPVEQGSAMLCRAVGGER